MWFAALALVSACASTSTQLSREERERLPLDGRQEIFDAENDVIIARNRADLAQEQLDALETSINGLDDIEAHNHKRLTANAATTPRIYPLRKMLRAQRAYLEARRDVIAAEIEVAGQETRIARARLALVKQRQLVRIGKAPLTSLADFEKVIGEQEEKAKGARGSSLDLRTKAQTLLDQWKLAQAEYAAQTGDYDSGIWLE
jgi:hypothetical protein